MIKCTGYFRVAAWAGCVVPQKTGTLVIISDMIKGLYQDEWINGVLYYTGMGKVGD